MRLPRIPRKTRARSLRQRLRPDQTKSGRNVAQTFSYHTQRSDPATNTGRDFRKSILRPAAKTAVSFWLQRFGLGVLLVTIGICIVSALTLSSNVRLQQLGSNDRSSLFHNQSAYQDTASNLIQASLLNHNKLTVNSAQIGQQLLKQYPELESASITLPLVSHRPTLYISYTKPALIIHNQSGSFVLDTNGKVLTATTQQAVNLGLPSISDDSGFQLALNAQVLSSKDINFIQTVITTLKAKAIPISSLSLSPSGAELDVGIGGKPYMVKFNLQSAPKLQIGTYLATEKRLQGEGIIPAHYLDVRVDGRAYYQ